MDQLEHKIVMMGKMRNLNNQTEKYKPDFRLSYSKGADMEIFKREEYLIGTENLQKLQKAKVLIFGVGGVGGYVCESLVRSGIGYFTLVDHDEVSESNINRQILALHSTLGRRKVDVMKERMLDINPNCKVEVYPTFFLPDNQDLFNFLDYDYIIDCIDTITAKIQIICEAKKHHVHVISSMGAGNRLDPSKIKVCDIFETSYDPLSKVMRRELKKRGIASCKVVFSNESPISPKIIDEEELIKANKRSVPGSSAFVPAAFGLMIASEVVKDLMNEH